MSEQHAYPQAEQHRGDGIATHQGYQVAGILVQHGRASRGRVPRLRRLRAAAGRLIGRGDQGFGHGAPRGLVGLQAPIDLVMGTLLQKLIALLDDPNELVLLARDLFEILVGELIPPPSEVLPESAPTAR